MSLEPGSRALLAPGHPGQLGRGDVGLDAGAPGDPRGDVVTKVLL